MKTLVEPLTSAWHVVTEAVVPTIVAALTEEIAGFMVWGWLFVILALFLLIYGAIHVFQVYGRVCGALTLVGVSTTGVLSMFFIAVSRL